MVFLLHFPKISHVFYVRGNKQPPPVDCFFFSKNTFNYKLQYQVKYMCIPQRNQDNTKSMNIRVLTERNIFSSSSSRSLVPLWQKRKRRPLTRYTKLLSYRMTPFWGRRNKPSPLSRLVFWSLSYKPGDQFSGVRKDSGMDCFNITGCGFHGAINCSGNVLRVAEVGEAELKRGRSRRFPISLILLTRGRVSNDDS